MQIIKIRSQYYGNKAVYGVYPQLIAIYALSRREEETVLEVLLRHAEEGRPLNRRYLQEALEMLIDAMPPARKERLPFKDGVPGVRFSRAFETRHKNVLYYGRGSRQEAKRWASVNAETVTTHFAQIEKLIEKHGIDSRRMWNLDETGGTPEKDVTGAVKEKRYMRRRGPRDIVIPEFVAASRATLMATVSAAGDTGPPLFIFKGGGASLSNHYCGWETHRGDLLLISPAWCLRMDGRKMLLT